MRLTAKEARELSQYFREMSVALGNYRFANWESLTPKDRETIEDIEWTVLNYSSDFLTQAVKYTLDDAQGSLEKIKCATNKAKSAVSKIKTARKIIGIANAVVTLGAAIVTQNPGAIVTAIRDVVKASTSDIG